MDFLELHNNIVPVFDFLCGKLPFTLSNDRKYLVVFDAMHISQILMLSSGHSCKACLFLHLGKNINEAKF